MASKDLEAIFESIVEHLRKENPSQKELLNNTCGIDHKRLEDILFEEAAFWLSLSPPFNQREHLELIILSVQNRLAITEGKHVYINQNRALEAVKRFLKTYRIERGKSGYRVPPSLALSFILQKSEEELKRRLKFLEEHPSLSKSSELADILRSFMKDEEISPPGRNRYLERQEELVLETLEEGNIERINERILPFLLSQALKSGFLKGFSFSLQNVFRGFRDVFEKRGDNLSLPFEIALYPLFLGRPEEALFWGGKIDGEEWARVFLEALCFYYQGNLESALEKVLSALEIFRARYRKKYPFALGIWGIFLARILACGGKPHRRDATRYLQRLLKEEPLLSQTGAREYFRQLRYEDGRIFNLLEDPIDHLFYAWIEEERTKQPESILKSTLRELRSFWALYRGKGLLFWAAEMARALAVLGDPEAKDWLVEKDLSFKGKETSSWRSVLQDLKQILEEKFSEGERCLVWAVDVEKYFLVPLEQKRRKDGSWTKGRPVSLKKLFERDYDFLSPEDEKVIAYIIEFRGHYRFKDEVFLGLAGHPRVVDLQTKTPLQVLEVLPRIILSQEREGLRLRIDPPLPPDFFSRIYLEQEGNQVKVFRVSREWVLFSDLLGKEGVLFPREAMKDLQELLAPLSRTFSLISDLHPEKAREIPPEKPLHLILRPVGEGLDLLVRARPLGDRGPSFLPGKGPERPVSWVEKELLTTLRDLKREKALLRNLENILDLNELLPEGEARWRAPDLETAVKLVEALENLPREDYLLFWPEGRPLTVVPSPDDIPLTGKSLSDWLEVDTPRRALGESIDFVDVLRRLREKPSRFIPITEGRFLALRENLYRRLRELAELAEIKGHRVRLHPLRAFLLAREGGTVIRGDENWEAFRKRLKKALSLKPDIPAELKTSLRPYQEEGFVWLRRLYEAELGGCLADDMGLGKTVQTLALLLSVAQNGPSLVVAPASVLSVWQEEVRRFAPALEVIPLGEVEDRDKILSDLQPAQIVLVSYGLLQQEETARLLAKIDWNVVVLDEAQHIKNYRSKRARHALKLKARFRLATTGTPIENRLEELWTIFRFLQPGLLGILEDFRRRFVVPIEKLGDQEARDRLKRLLRPFILRRIKTEVLKDLPPRTETVLRLEFSPEERKLYENLRLEALQKFEKAGEDPRARTDILAQLMRLRQLCCSPRLIDPSLSLPETKLSALLELLEGLLIGGHRVLVFSQFVSFLRLIEGALSRKGVSFFTLEGALSARKRQELVTRFQNGERQVFLISLKAGGVGLNLTTADYVILTDPWWNPAVENQAADRAHRIGQSRPVTVYRLVIKDTVEEKVLELHQKKRRLGEEILAETGTPSLSLEELKNLLLSS